MFLGSSGPLRELTQVLLQQQVDHFLIWLGQESYRDDNPMYRMCNEYVKGTLRIVQLCNFVVDSHNRVRQSLCHKVSLENLKVVAGMKSDLERHDWVKRMLRQKQITFQQIADELSVSPSSVTLVSQKRRKSRAISNAIAVKLGMNLSEIWPTPNESEKDDAPD